MWLSTRSLASCGGGYLDDWDPQELEPGLAGDAYGARGWQPVAAHHWAMAWLKSRSRAPAVESCWVVSRRCRSSRIFLWTREMRSWLSWGRLS